MSREVAMEVAGPERGGGRGIAAESCGTLRELPDSSVLP